MPLRRVLLLAPLILLFASRAGFSQWSRPAPAEHGPQLLVARRGDAQVFILGFGEARDTSWLTPKIRTAFERSSELWLETAPPKPPGTQTPDERQAAADRMYRLSHDSGRTLFDALEPKVRERTRAYIAELGIAMDSIRPLRPWRAYYSIVAAFWSKQKTADHAVYVDAVLREMAQKSAKRVGYESPTSDATMTFFSSMSDEAQSQYIEWLLDFLDDYKLGRNDDSELYSWVAGNPGRAPTRSLNRMRLKEPALYDVMQPRRNAWWARKIDELLSTSGSYFVAVGQLHVLGPDGIPSQLARRGIEVESMTARSP